MRINTRTDSLELLVVEKRTIASCRKLMQQLGKHGTESIQEQAAKAVVALNKIELELDAAANETVEV
jgi:hypothetical protein